MSRELFYCPQCKSRFKEPILLCPKCGGVVDVVVEEKDWKPRGTGLWRYESMLPRFKVKISLGEACTPLIRSKWYTRVLGVDVWFKDESRNPTGSMFDRVSALIASHILSEGHSKVITASDGNMGASLLAYLAGTNVKVKVIVPRNVDIGKKAQMELYGGEIEVCGEYLDEAVDYAIKLASTNNYYNATVEVNPLGYVALKTIAYEIYEQMGSPDTIIVPAASGTTAYAIYKGFKDLVNLGLIDRVPRITIVQTPPYPSIAWEKHGTIEAYTSSQAIVGLTYKNPPLRKVVVNIIEETRGEIIVVSTEEDYELAIELARKEGLLVEPASAAALAGLKKARNLSKDVIVILTGSGLKMLASYLEARKGKAIYYIPTKAMILRILDEEDELHGYAIWRRLEGRITPQTVYQHLSELRRRGLVEMEIKNRRKVYRLTPKGKQVLELLKQIEG